MRGVGLANRARFSRDIQTSEMTRSGDVKPDLKIVESGKLNRGAHFRASTLRGTASGEPIDPFIGVELDWR